MCYVTTDRHNGDLRFLELCLETYNLIFLIYYSRINLDLVGINVIQIEMEINGNENEI